jgi:predicted signal transduction protein with EAL and GGDEF domain
MDEFIESWFNGAVGAVILIVSAVFFAYVGYTGQSSVFIAIAICCAFVSGILSA